MGLSRTCRHGLCSECCNSGQIRVVSLGTEHALLTSLAYARGRLSRDTCASRALQPHRDDAAVARQHVRADGMV